MERMHTRSLDPYYIGEKPANPQHSQWLERIGETMTGSEAYKTLILVRDEKQIDDSMIGKDVCKAAGHAPGGPAIIKTATGSTSFRTAAELQQSWQRLDL